MKSLPLSIRASLLLAVLLLARNRILADQVDDLVAAELTRQNVPGLSLAVVKDGRLVRAQGYGLANRKDKIAATPNTVHKIASVSKQFLASGVMLLAQEGLLHVDDPIAKHLDGTPPSWNTITIRHLLTHTSGIAREAPGFDPDKAQTDAEVIKTAFPLKLQFAPGEKWAYGNTGYFILAEIIQKRSGRPWTEYLSERIFVPVGMDSTFPTNTKANVPNRAVGYSDNDTLKIADDWSALRPSGAFLSTVLDLAKWDAALYTEQPLSQDSRREMWTPVKLNSGATHNYGYGWELGKIDERRLVHHSGGMPGFRTSLARLVDDRLTIIVLMNLDDADITPIVSGVAKLYVSGGIR